jgi:transposase
LGAADWAKSDRKGQAWQQAPLDLHGIPLAIKLTGANCHDSSQALPCSMAFRRPKGCVVGRAVDRTACLGERVYDVEYIRRALRTRQILPWLDMRNSKHGSGLGRWRWVVERTFAWLNQFRRLRVRYEKRSDMDLAF